MDKVSLKIFSLRYGAIFGLCFIIFFGFCQKTNATSIIFEQTDYGAAVGKSCGDGTTRAKENGLKFKADYNATISSTTIAYTNYYNLGCVLRALIVEDNAETPTGNVLATSTNSISCQNGVPSPPYRPSFVFSPAVSVATGTEYWIVIEGVSGCGSGSQALDIWGKNATTPPNVAEYYTATGWATSTYTGYFQIEGTGYPNGTDSITLTKPEDATSYSIHDFSWGVSFTVSSSTIAQYAGCPVIVDIETGNGISTSTSVWDVWTDDISTLNYSDTYLGIYTTPKPTVLGNYTSQATLWTQCPAWEGIAGDAPHSWTLATSSSPGAGTEYPTAWCAREQICPDLATSSAWYDVAGWSSGIECAGRKLMCYAFSLSPTAKNQINAVRDEAQTKPPISVIVGIQQIVASTTAQISTASSSPSWTILGHSVPIFSENIVNQIVGTSTRNVVRTATGWATMIAFVWSTYLLCISIL